MSLTGADTATPSFTAPDDGVYEFSVVVADSEGETDTDGVLVTVDNVAPTVTGLTPSTTSVVGGANVTFTGTATDPSTVDVAAGFDWQLSSGGVSTAWGALNTLSVPAPETCGAFTVDGFARDKDGGVSGPYTVSVTAVGATYLPPLVVGDVNKVKAGQVVPVKVFVGCDGSFLTGLHPAIQLLNGDFDPATDPGDDANLVTASVSSADTNGVMREVTGQYIYNLRIPAGSVGAKYTIRVRPFGTSGGASYVLLQLRK